MPVENLTKELVGQLQDIYLDARSSRVLLLGIDFPAARIPTFGMPATFWTEVGLALESGTVIDGIAKLAAAAAREHPGNTALAELARRLGTAGPVTVLCLFTDPQRTSKIRLDSEARELQDIADRGGIRVSMRHAVRTGDIIRAVLAERPGIVHFAGHGTVDGQLIFGDNHGSPTAIDAERFADAIAAASEYTLDCVVLNSCYTAANAEALRGATRAVAGSVTSLDDDRAIAFARGFYTGIAGGQSVARAFDSGRAEAGFGDSGASGLHFVPFPDA